MLSDELRDLKARLGFTTNAQLASYLGTCESTVNKWLGNVRVPSSSVFHLIFVLELIEKYSSVLHSELVNRAIHDSNLINDLLKK